MARPDHLLSDVPGVVSAAELLETVDAIASIQLADGNIPWFPGGHSDPWNMVEAAMALDLGGRHDESRAAYDWLAGTQRADGGWHAYYLGDDIEDPTLDTNVTCYIATGAWHHHLVTGDTPYLRQLWPTVEAAIDFALDFQRETGEIAWRGDDPDDGALLTGSSSIHHSLKCALAIAERLGHERPDWELSLGALAIAASTRFHGSVCAPGVHGMLPSGSWTDAIASTVSRSSAAVTMPSTVDNVSAGVIGRSSGCTRRGSSRARG
jgi:hypothetical protein